MTASTRLPGPVHDIELGLLRLPYPTDDFESCAGCRPVADPPVCLHNDANTVAWYRWLLGHHVVFGIWRLMLAALAADDELTQPRLAALYDSYSALLLYSGSCTPEAYVRVLRPRMYAADPAMSGTWARDFNRVRELQSRLTVPPDSPLAAAVRRNRKVHIKVAARLVPEGRSLLQDSGRDLRQKVTSGESDTMDAFFRTERGPICRHRFATQSRARAEAVLADLAANPVRAVYGHAATDEFGLELADHIATPLRLGEPLLFDGSSDNDHI
ncbi:L-tyrosine 3-hydroxylase [Nocardia macrotermitis]|uniref:Uncharacterized protein n=1 Tax=Nocardia macrotermitis TaxID=2585198 RepID=A0A7K0CX88_9NOCA|nr:L-tyrosine 3-hydroxylase [Nocardia macrotermitis]MQY18117.1 hypothetical protein [Nocardia macrotermitis]